MTHLSCPPLGMASTALLSILVMAALKSLEGDSKESLLLEPTDIETFTEQECYPQIYAVNERTVKTYSSTNRKIICKVSKNITNVTAVSNVTEVTKVNYAKKFTINRRV